MYHANIISDVPLFPNAESNFVSFNKTSLILSCCNYCIFYPCWLIYYFASSLAFDLIAKIS